MAIFSAWRSTLDPDLSDKARMRPLVKTWKVKGTGSLPAWRDFDLTDFRGWYGILLLTDHSKPGSPFCKMYGSKLADVFGADFTGAHPRDLFSAQRGDIGEAFADYLEQVVMEGRVGLAAFDIQNDRASNVKALSLPLAGAMVLTAFVGTQAGAGARFDPAHP